MEEELQVNNSQEIFLSHVLRVINGEESFASQDRLFLCLQAEPKWIS